MKKDSLGDRMKRNYENVSRTYLTRRTPVIMRLDGRAFHTLTKNCVKPFDFDLQEAMRDTAFKLCLEIQGAKIAYTQSDEISILITDYDQLTTTPWFDYNIQKMCSISSSIASTKFSQLWGKTGLFDCRVFNIPRDEVVNYFVWRQKDWLRNSLSMLCQANFSHKELQGKKAADMHEMLWEKGINWADLSDRSKNGTTFYGGSGWNEDNSLVFTQNREMLENLF